MATHHHVPAETPPPLAVSASSGTGQQRHPSRHTIHPKLSLSAKRSTSSMTAGTATTTMSAAGVGQHENGASTSFQLTVAFSNAENGKPITFKPDGNRFKTSQRTLKLRSNCKYHVALKAKPTQDFLNLHISGSDLELVNADGQPPGSGEYIAVWNTTGITPSKKGVRQDILFVLSGTGKTLSQKLQTKFYTSNDSHSDMGTRLNALVWSCELDPLGHVQVKDEKLL